MAIKSEDHSDLTLFGNRLWKLMQEKGIDNPKDLASCLYNNGLVKVTQKDSSYEFEDSEKAKNNAIESTKKKIIVHLHSDSPDKLQGEFAHAYCVFFGCSADYLLGIIPEKTHQITDISSYTGLSESSIEKIHGFNIHKSRYEGYIDSLNTILESKNFDSILDQIRGYRKALNDLEISSNEWNKVRLQIPDYIIQSISDNGDKPEYLDTNKAEKEYDQARDRVYALEYYGMVRDFLCIIDEIKGTQN